MDGWMDEWIDGLLDIRNYRVYFKNNQYSSYSVVSFPHYSSSTVVSKVI